MCLKSRLKLARDLLPELGEFFLADHPHDREPHSEADNGYPTSLDPLAATDVWPEILVAHYAQTDKPGVHHFHLCASRQTYW